jgi:hypothetical protein
VFLSTFLSGGEPASVFAMNFVHCMLHIGFGFVGARYCLDA